MGSFDGNSVLITVVLTCLVIALVVALSWRLVGWRRDRVVLPLPGPPPSSTADDIGEQIAVRAEVRVWQDRLSEIQQATRDLEPLRSEVLSLGEELACRRNEIAAVQAELEVRRATLAEAGKRGRHLADELEGLYRSHEKERQLLASVVEEVGLAREEAAEAQQRCDHIVAAADMAQARLVSLQEEEAGLGRALAVVRGDLATNEDLLRASEAALEDRRRDVLDLERQSCVFATEAGEVATLRARVGQSLASLTDDIAAAEIRLNQLVESTLDARRRRDILAGEVISLYEERAGLVERVSEMRIAALDLEYRLPVAPKAQVASLIRPAPAPAPAPAPVTGPIVNAQIPSIPERASIARSIEVASVAPQPGMAGILATSSGRPVARWRAWAQTTAKPRNDSFGDGGEVVWRRNEDRFRLSQIEGAGGMGLLAAVSDGAGASGIFCGAWAETLVGKLPDAPISDLEALNCWLDGFCLDFRSTHSVQAKVDPTRHSKFVREGSFATLVVCWLGLYRGGGAGDINGAGDADAAVLHWLGYGDSPLLVFDRSANCMVLVESHPTSLADFDRDPHLLNWKNMPDSARLRTGMLRLPRLATIILASDGIGQFLALRHMASCQGRSGSQAMDAEYLALMNRNDSVSGGGRLAAAAKRHAMRPARSFSAELAEVSEALADESKFAALVSARHGDELLANDDSTVIMIEVDHGTYSAV
ncbi:MAG: hypothetical protein WCK65_12530 [Rhodospirillaceae bacterium]